MKTSKTALKSIIAATAIGVALTGMTVTAQAAPQKPGTGMQLKDRVQDLRENINVEHRDHKLTDNEVTRLTGRLNDIVALQQSYEKTNHGLDTKEAASLNDKLNQLASDIRADGENNKNDHHG